MLRTPEPEIMDDEEQAVAYARSDFSQSNQLFVDMFLADHRGVRHALDLGTGPADVPVRMARADPDIRITAVDGSAPMLKCAGEAVRGAGLEGRITLVQGRFPGVELEYGGFDALLAKDFLHHLPEPMVLWHGIRERAREGTIVYVMDLFRPETEEEAQHISEEACGNEHPVVMRDLLLSLKAAFNVDEVRAQAREVGLELDIGMVTDKHWLGKGRV